MAQKGSRKILSSLAREVDRMCSWGPWVTRNTKQLLLKRVLLLSAQLGSIVNQAGLWDEWTVSSVADEMILWLQYRVTSSLSAPFSADISQKEQHAAELIIPPSPFNLLSAEFPQQNMPLRAEVVQSWRLRIMLSVFVTVVVEVDKCAVVQPSLRPRKSFIETVVWCDSVMNVP